MLCEEEVVKSGREGGRRMLMLICFGPNLGLCWRGWTQKRSDGKKCLVLVRRVMEER
jgi:hypothetical protein